MQPTLFTEHLILRPLLRVPKAAPNLGSRRISERTGMRLIRTDTGNFVEGTFPRDIWEMTREEWLASHPLQEPFSR